MDAASQPPLPELSARQTEDEISSPLYRLLRLLEDVGPLRASFDDLTGVSLDFPEFILPEDHRRHTCAFCRLSKSHVSSPAHPTMSDCELNKRATNGIALRRKAGFCGLCHLGVFDLVEPLVYHGVVLGVFYYGSVRVAEFNGRSLARIRGYGERRGIASSALELEFANLPVISRAEIDRYQQALRTVAESAVFICEALGVPVKRYHGSWLPITWRAFARQPALIRMVGAYVVRNYNGPCRVKDLAERFRCHPNYLGVLFKKQIGMGLSDYVDQVRIERAKHLLRGTQLSAGEIGFQCGFAEHSHFGKVFKKSVGFTPGDFRAHSWGKLSHIDPPSGEP